MPSPPPTDPTWRFEQEILPHLDVAYRMAKSLVRDEDRAADLVQDSVLRALRAYPRLEHTGNLRAWLARIVHTTFLDRVRYEKRRPEDPVEDPVSAGESSGLEPEHWEPRVVRESLDDTVEEALCSLPPGWRAVIHMVDVEGFAYDEAAEALGLPVGTVRSRLHRARQRVYDRLRSQQPPAVSEKRSGKG